MRFLRFILISFCFSFLIYICDLRLSYAVISDNNAKRIVSFEILDDANDCNEWKSNANVDVNVDNAICETIRIEIPKGWSVYSKNEVENGRPFQLKLNKKESHNVESVEFKYPKDNKTLSFLDDKEKVEILVYQGSDVIKVFAHKKDPSIKAILSLDINYVACGDNKCVPERATLTKIVPVNTGIANESLNIRYILFYVLLAFIGGFILNFMPCVLPVISIKILHLTKYFGGHKGVNIRSNLLFIVLGILISFMVLSIIAISIKNSGDIVGWGLHFQNPYFIVILSYIMVILTMSILDQFTFTLPSNFTSFLTSFHFKSEYINSLFYGLLLTLLATPCTAPFLGAAVSFSITQPNVIIFLIYFFIGLGMSFPYLCIIMKPSIVTNLPKPGAWMNIVKKILVIPLIVTIMWLIYILSSHINLYFLIGFICSIVILVCLLLRRNKNRFFRRFFSIGVMIFFIIMMIPYFIKYDDALILNDVNTAVVDFNEDKVKKEAMNGQVILVNVTADWCITCKVNEKLVLSSDTIKDMLDKKAIKLITLDYTNQSPKIAQYLAKHKKYGVPFTICYGPNNPDGVLLPEIFTIHNLENIIKEVS